MNVAAALKAEITRVSRKEVRQLKYRPPASGELFGDSFLYLYKKMDVPFLIGRNERVSDVQLSSSGYDDPITGECWPRNWTLESADLD